MFRRLFSKEALTGVVVPSSKAKPTLKGHAAVKGLSSLFRHDRISSGISRHGNFIEPADEYNQHISKTSPSTVTLEGFVPLEEKLKPGDNYEEEDLLLRIPIRKLDNPLVSSEIESEIMEENPTLIKYHKKVDVFKAVKYHLEDEYMNVALLSRFISPQGRILPRTKTGLSLKSHKKMTRSILRSRNLGILPNMYRPTTNFNKPATKRNRF